LVFTIKLVSGWYLQYYSVLVVIHHPTRFFALVLIDIVLLGIHKPTNQLINQPTN
jgi:hypothetical protein